MDDLDKLISANAVWISDDNRKKCPINEIKDDLTRNMAWELFNHIDYADLCDLYKEYLYCGRIGEAITAAKNKKMMRCERSD